MIFGDPVLKAAPSNDGKLTDMNDTEENDDFHPLKGLLRGQNCLSDKTGSNDKCLEVELDHSGALTFNSERFLRVMAICHTVVIEKDIDPSKFGKQRKAEAPKLNECMARFLPKLGKKSQSQDPEESTLSPISESDDHADEEEPSSPITSLSVERRSFDKDTDEEEATLE